MVYTSMKRQAVFFRIILIVIFVITAGSIILSFYVQQLLLERTHTNFTSDTQQVTQKILDHIDRQNVILQNARSLVTSSPAISQTTWQTFFSSQNTLGNNKGINSISYAEVVQPEQKQTFEDTMRANPLFGDNFSIHPAGDRDKYLVASLVVAKSDVSKGFGFDNYSTPERRETYDLAEKNNAPQASPPLLFATGHLGFFVALPIVQSSTQTAQGFIIMSFHSADFLAFLESETPSPIVLKVTDETNVAKPIELFQHKQWNNTPADVIRSDTIDFAGRTWQIDFKSSRGYKDPLINFVGPRIILLTAGMLVLSIILSYFIVERRRAAKRSSSSRHSA